MGVGSAVYSLPVTVAYRGERPLAGTDVVSVEDDADAWPGSGLLSYLRRPSRPGPRSRASGAGMKTCPSAHPLTLSPFWHAPCKYVKTCFGGER